MGILYGVVARGAVVLAEHTAVSTNAADVARQIMERLPRGGTSDGHVSYAWDEYIFHVLCAHGVTVLCMAHHSFGRRVPFAFLEDVHQIFVKTYGRAVQTAPPYAMNDGFSRVLSHQMEYYSSDSNSDMINHLKGEMNQVCNIMIEKVDKILDRGDQLELLVDKSEHLQENTVRFRKQARYFRSTVWWRNAKFLVELILILLVIVYFVLAFICSGVTLPSCLT